jgi:hypothetical protein
VLSGRERREKGGGNDVVRPGGRAVGQGRGRRAADVRIIENRDLSVHENDECLDPEGVEDQAIKIIGVGLLIGDVG